MAASASSQAVANPVVTTCCSLQKDSEFDRFFSDVQVEIFRRLHLGTHPGYVCVTILIFKIERTSIPSIDQI